MTASNVLERTSLGSGTSESGEMNMMEEDELRYGRTPIRTNCDYCDYGLDRCGACPHKEVE